MLTIKDFRPRTVAAVTIAVLFAAPTAYADTQLVRVNAGATQTVDLSLCSSIVDVVVVGDQDTDVDFEIYNPRGRLVHYDDDPTDFTYWTAQRSASGCSPYQLVLRNLGDVHNNVRVSVDGR